jgi:diaminopropionate ammonia-lyase
VPVTATLRATVNPRLRPEHVAPPAGDAVLRFHRGLAGYRPTPLRRLAEGGVWFKDESDRLGLPAFKILGAAWAVDRAVAADPATTTLVAASAGNHGRAVAHAAAARGLACRVLLPSAVSPARAARIADEGAQVHRVEGDYDAAVAAAERHARVTGAALIADVGTAPSATWVIDGYATLFREAAAQAGAPFDLIVVPVGVGSLAAAAARSAAHQRPPAAVVGVEPTTAACVTASLVAGRPVTVPTPGTSMGGMDCATPSAAAWPTLRDGLAGTVTVDDAEAHQAMRRLAGEGIVAGDCGAATVAGLEALRDDPRCGPLRAALGAAAAPTARVLCVGTEGATDPDAYARVVAAAPDGDRD